MLLFYFIIYTFGRVRWRDNTTEEKDGKQHPVDL